ncbi:hypothetical protein VaNZ11_008049 [Volvox africanus]|uniref:Uncharacterized protein n=1 Tax=Volvox africanus TaxID=51714 RepID=A0ABQ5S4H5_9CHLO|nr:hypothetical protein VaNZ11_008049 [Volvox africanus]
MKGCPAYEVRHISVLHFGRFSSVRRGQLLFASTTTATIKTLVPTFCTTRQLTAPPTPTANLTTNIRTACSCPSDQHPASSFSESSSVQPSATPDSSPKVSTSPLAAAAPKAAARSPGPAGSAPKPAPSNTNFCQMLSRYRSVSVLALPGFYNNPAQGFEENREWCQECIRKAGSGEILRTAFRLWDGPLFGIAHQDGQFAALEEGPAGEAVTPVPEGLAKGLSLDLDFLVGLAELTRNLQYNAYSSESDYNVIPIILEPRLDASRRLAPAGEPQSSSHAAASGSGGGNGGGGDGGGGCWWSLEQALATPLSWEEVAASLGVPWNLAEVAVPPVRFDSKEAFLSHIVKKHVSHMDGGEFLDRIAAQNESRVNLPGSPAASAASRLLLQPEEIWRQIGLGTELPPPLPPQQQQEQQRNPETMLLAVREFADVVTFPVVLEVVVGSDELGWNPIPLLWLGRSRRSGAILGLMTAVVWT